MQVFSGNVVETKTFLGDVLQPEQMEEHRKVFDRTQTGEPGMIDFKKAKFIGLGTLLKSNATGRGASLYSLEVEIDGVRLDTKDLQPYFLMTPWKGT